MRSFAVAGITLACLTLVAIAVKGGLTGAKRPVSRLTPPSRSLPCIRRIRTSGACRCRSHRSPDPKPGAASRQLPDTVAMS